MVELIFALVIVQYAVLQVLRFRSIRRHPRFRAVPAWAIVLNPTLTGIAVFAGFSLLSRLLPLAEEAAIVVSAAAALAVAVPVQILRYRVLGRAGVMDPEPPAPDAPEAPGPSEGGSAP